MITQSAHGSDQSCHNLLVEPIEVFNLNARTPMRHYTNGNSRGLAEYQSRLGGRFGELIRRPGATVLDVGCGYGVAGLSLVSEELTARVTVVNAQDNWSPILQWRTSRDDQDYLAQLPLVGILHELGFRYRRNEGEAYLDSVLEQITQVVQPLMDGGRFQYLVGFAESILPDLHNKFLVISDLYGAYYYSGARMQLIEQYYDHLEEGGEAYIVFTGTEPMQFLREGEWSSECYEHGPQSVVHVAQGRQVMSLESYLVDLNPKVFSQHRFVEGVCVSNRVLVMRKIASVPHLGLGALLQQVEMKFPEQGDSYVRQLPMVVYQEKAL